MHHAPAAALSLCCLLSSLASAQVPDGYVDEPVLGGLAGPVGIRFDDHGRGYLWQRNGMVFVVENGQKVDPPLLDISDEVGNWRDFGMLGFVLDPEFHENGYLYCYYVVDRHHLVYAGTPSYDPTANWYYEATIGRVTRYQADAATDFTTLVPDSRVVLLGETAQTGVPILYESHGTGSLAFGADGTLLVSGGDGANYNGIDSGSSFGTYWEVALADGIIRPEENVGAFRSQMIGCHSGKILRLDPQTGDGLPSNPFYDPAQPRAPRSRVWALGLRNPFRFGVRPGTGDPDPSHGNPGVLDIGDVGFSRREDLHVVPDGGWNLGWPLFEGLTWHTGYRAAGEVTFNLDAPNPLYGSGSCTQEYFTFRDLIQQERENHNPKFPNPCDSSVKIPPSTPTFMHHRPAIDWYHNGQVARVPTFNDKGKSTVSQLGDPECPVAGHGFQGFCAVGGFWHSGFGFGDYAGLYFACDYAANWIRAFRIDGTNTLLEVLDFATVTTPVFACEDPADGSLLYMSLNGKELRRIRFLGGGNAAPQPKLVASDTWGPAPLAVRFDGSTSEDPEHQLLTFAWDFGDGATSDEPSPEHLFDNALGGPATRAVTLTVNDPDGGSTVAERTIHLDNSPPRVRITSFEDGATYATSGSTSIDLVASVADAEHGPSELSYAWVVYLVHDSHEHPEAPITEPTATVVLSPTPCSGSFYAYRIELTVTDALGLATTTRKWLYPDCQVGTTVAVTEPGDASRWLPGDVVDLAADVAGPVDRVRFYVDGQLVGVSDAAPFSTTWSVPSPAPERVTVSALAETPTGETASSPGKVAGIAVPTVLTYGLEGVREDAWEAPDQTVSLGGSSLPLGTGSLVALRFPVDLKPGALLISARLELTADAPGADATTLEVRAEASDDAAPLTPAAGNLSQRAVTAASATWEPAPWLYAGESGAREHTVDLRAVLQEVVTRPGFTQRSHVVLLLSGAGARQIQAATNLTQGARLVIEAVGL